MQDLDDNALLREYVDHDSQKAFAALVERHVNKVYSVALRATRNPSQAEEITQAVFVILAQKSRSLGSQVILSGWLYHAARLTATTFIRSEIRRARREQEALMQSTLNEPSPGLWEELSPLIDDVIGKLGEKDRDALVLRYFDDKSMQEVGAALGASEDAAKMRVGRALERIRTALAKRGVHCAPSILAKELSSHSVGVAPAALAKSATALALTKGAAASTSTLTLIKGALKIMAWTKTKTAILAVVIVAFTATGVTGYKVVQAHRFTDLLEADTEIGSDGMVRSQLRLEMINHSGETVPAHSTISVFSGAEVDQMTDDTGQEVKYGKEPGVFDNGAFTNMNKYIVTLNHAVPPGGKIIWNERDEIDGQRVIHEGQPLLQPTGIPGEFQLTDHEQYGFPDTLRVKGVVRLPAGAVLLERTEGFTVTTNRGQVELHYDATLPPPNIADSSIRYRLADGVK